MLSTSLLKESSTKFVGDSYNHCAVVDRLAELGEFSGCSSGVVCFTSHRQWALSDIFEARNIEVVNKVILYMIIYYGKENCVLLGYYAASSVDFIQKFRNNLSY